MAAPMWLVRALELGVLLTCGCCLPRSTGTLARTRPQPVLPKEASRPPKPAIGTENPQFKRDWVIWTSPREGALGPHPLTKGARQAHVLRSQEERGHHRNWDKGVEDGDVKPWSGE